MTFAAELGQFKIKAMGDVTTTVRAITQQLFNSIVLSSPVDTGRFRGNWQVSLNAPITSETDRLDPSGATAIADISTLVSSVGSEGGKVYLVNNVPYAEVLEYGGYPDPVKQGSWVKGTGWVIKSVAGFSKQAPQGMVRVNFTRIATLLRESAP